MASSPARLAARRMDCVPCNTRFATTMQEGANHRFHGKVLVASDGWSSAAGLAWNPPGDEVGSPRRVTAGHDRCGDQPAWQTAAGGAGARKRSS